MLKTRFLILLLCSFFFDKVVFSQRVLDVKKSNNPIIIDGELNESQWKDANITGDFTARSPVFGGPSKFPTKVQVYYDDNAIYVGAQLIDRSPDSVKYNLSQRDETGNGDWFRVSIDPYGNNSSAFVFGVTAAGVEFDALAALKGSDKSWNAVWKSATKRQDYGWSVEIKIPFSAIRFPNTEVQDWHVNFTREVRRLREQSDWNPVDPNKFGVLTQSGHVSGIKNIKSPIRLSFTPYVTGYLQNSYDEISGEQTWQSRVTGGLDLKYGLNDAFTLDMTLIPDFGQTRSDNQVLNLGPFEVRFNENRPFFIEGTDLFQIGGVFYSRRIGASPFNQYDVYDDLRAGEYVLSNPVQSQLVNGTKVSGRTKSGLGIGVFNAVEGRTFATVSDSLGGKRKFRTNSLTNYNVFVLSQNLKNNSSVSFVNTNVTREGENRDANVTVGEVSLFSPNGKYKFRSNVNVSSIFEGGENEFGHKTEVELNKVDGKWQFGINYEEESDTYDHNDLGFLYNNNSRVYQLSGSWNNFKESKHFYRRKAEISWFYEELYKPQLYNSSGFSWSIGGLHKKQIYMQLSGRVRPFGIVDHFESREFGKIVRYNGSTTIGYFLSTDYSKRFALDGGVNFTQFISAVQNEYDVWISPRFNLSDRMNLILKSNIDVNNNSYGYVRSQDPIFLDEIVLGVRDRINVENSIGAEFLFTKRMGVELDMRHYWAQVSYDKFQALENNGITRPIDYQALSSSGESVHNTNFNAFTVDANYRWVFYPGCELRVVYKNNIFSSKSILEQSYFETFSTLFNEPRINSVSLKLLVFVDALYFKRKKM